MKNSIYSQLGFLPENMTADALEVSRAISSEKFSLKHPEIKKFPLIRCSDAHYPEHIGIAYTDYYMEKASFSEIRMALKGANGRKIVIP
jgi:PHP family Zn ribbon phosphoesterase